MGYDLHIMREGGIPLEEWLAQTKEDPELSQDPDSGPGFMNFSPDTSEGWFSWSDGEIVSKYPDLRTRQKMVALAQGLGARVEGDDGEVYGADGEPEPFPTPPETPKSSKPGWLARVVNRTQDVLSRLSSPPGPFRRGQRVRCSVQGEGVVLACDRSGVPGMGGVKVRFDDGSVEVRSACASGLDPID